MQQCFALRYLVRGGFEALDEMPRHERIWNVSRLKEQKETEHREIERARSAYRGGVRVRKPR